MNRARFQRKGPLALDASAWGQEYELIKPAPQAADGGVAVVMVMGPLTHHGDWWGGDTYDDIEARVQAALDTSADTVVMKVASPGGEVDGMIECSRTLRRMAHAKGKRLIAYVDEVAASAAYALACAADEIYLPASGQVGSIGVIDVVCDATAADHQDGLNMAVITSGARKADGNPHVQLTDETRSVLQANVNALAELFFGLVAESRGIDPFAVQAMQAAMYRGQEAVNAKLADGVKRWDELLAVAVSGAVEKPNEAEAKDGNREASMPNYAKALEAIKAALAEDAPAAPPPENKDGGQSPMDAAAFKSALKSLLAEEPAHEEPDGDEGADPVKPSDKDGDEEKAKAAARTASTDPVVQALALAQEAKAEAAKLRAERQAEKDAAEIKSLLDARTDLDPKARALLAKKPLAYVREALEFIPRVVNPAASAQVTPTLGAGQGGVAGGVASAQSPEAAEMDARMGLAPLARGTRREGNELILPVVSAEQAKARLAELNKINGGA